MKKGPYARFTYGPFSGYLLRDGPAARPTAYMLLQVTFAQPDRLRRDFDELVVVDELDRVFERHLDRRHETHGFIGARGAHVGQLLALDRIHDEIVVAAVDADDHAFVQRIAGHHEHAAAILQ